MASQKLLIEQLLSARVTNQAAKWVPVRCLSSVAFALPNSQISTLASTTSTRQLDKVNNWLKSRHRGRRRRHDERLCERFTRSDHLQGAAENI